MGTSPHQPADPDEAATDRGKVLERFRLIRPFLQEGGALTRIAAANGLSLRTLRRWVSRYRTHGLGFRLTTPVC